MSRCKENSRQVQQNFSTSSLSLHSEKQIFSTVSEIVGANKSTFSGDLEDTYEWDRWSLFRSQLVQSQALPLQLQCPHGNDLLQDAHQRPTLSLSCLSQQMEQDSVSVTIVLDFIHSLLSNLVCTKLVVHTATAQCDLFIQPAGPLSLAKFPFYWSYCPLGSIILFVFHSEVRQSGGSYDEHR